MGPRQTIGCSSSIKKADRHDPHTVGHERFHFLAIARGGPLALQPHHAWLAGSVDIRIEQTHAGAVTRQCDRKVRRRGRLADTTLARRDGDDVADARQRLQRALDTVLLDAPADGNLDRPDPRLLSEALREVGLQSGTVVTQREAQLDLDLHGLAFLANGLHSFGVRQRHPEAGFYIILDHETGCGDATVGHELCLEADNAAVPRGADCSGIDLS
jgi:hypothetical protein